MPIAYGNRSVEGTVRASGTIAAGDAIIGPVTAPGDIIVGWAWTQTGGPSVVTMQRQFHGGAWRNVMTSDAVDATGDFFLKEGHSLRLTVTTADFVTGTSVAGEFA